MRDGHRLRGERLDILDGVAGGVFDEAADSVQAKVVRDVCRRFGTSLFSIDVLRSSAFILTRPIAIKNQAHMRGASA
jgi:hypothetical protein